MASNNGTTFGASIVPTEHRPANKQQTSIFDSPAITPAVSREDLNAAHDHLSPSPFADLPTRLAPTHTRQSSRPSTTTNEKDLEAGVHTPLTDDNPFTSKVSVECNKECAMWPSKQTLMEKQKAEKKRRRDMKHCGGCGPVVEFWARFNKKQKLIIKIVMALLLLGAMIGIGVGISIAVNGTVYAGDDRSAQIPDPNSR